MRAGERDVPPEMPAVEDLRVQLSSFQFWVEPMFRSGESCAAADDGAQVDVDECVLRLLHIVGVVSRMRLPSSCVSKPYSIPRSFRLRSAFADWLAASPGVSTPDVEPASALQVLAARGKGRQTVRAARLHAARAIRGTRAERVHPIDHFGKNDSSEISQERLAFGYFTLWNFVPNALFWSVRTATVKNSRSRNAPCSCTNSPSVLVATGQVCPPSLVAA